MMYKTAFFLRNRFPTSIIFRVTQKRYAISSAIAIFVFFFFTRKIFIDVKGILSNHFIIYANLCQNVLSIIFAKHNYSKALKDKIVRVLIIGQNIYGNFSDQT